MDKGKIAEWFISLVMERPQAASVVGDLLETGASRSGGWFWSNVFRTWIATAWRDGRSQPRFVFGIAALGAVVQYGASIVCSLTWVFADWGFSHLFPVPPGTSGLVLLTSVVSPFYAGRWIARVSHGRDVAICAAMVIMGPIVYSAVGALLWWFSAFIVGAVPLGAVPRFTFIGWNGWVIFSFVPSLLGAALVRRRRPVPGAS